MLGPSHDPAAILDGPWKRVPRWATHIPKWAVWPLAIIVVLLVVVGPVLAFTLVLRLTLDPLGSVAAATACASLGLHLADGLRRRRVHDDLADLHAARIDGRLTASEFEMAKDRVNALRDVAGDRRRRASRMLRTVDLLTMALFGLFVLRALLQALEGVLR
jgi:hypothetical protein